MKITIIILFTIQICIFSQTNKEVISGLNAYADSVDNLISTSSGAPGEIYVNSVNSIKNIRAIGIQETKISYFYFQRDDSVYENSEGSVFFIPMYYPPLKILIEYNIAASQNVEIAYFPGNNGLLYRLKSTGAYGNTYRSFWFSKEELVMYEEKNSGQNNNYASESGIFSKEVYNNGLIVTDNLKEYIKLYNEINNIAARDK